MQHWVSIGGWEELPLQPIPQKRPFHANSQKFLRKHEFLSPAFLSILTQDVEYMIRGSGCTALQQWEDMTSHLQSSSSSVGNSRQQKVRHQRIKIRLEIMTKHHQGAHLC